MAAFRAGAVKAKQDCRVTVVDTKEIQVIFNVKIMRYRLFVRLLTLLFVGLFVFLAVINADTWVEPRFNHSLFRSEFLGNHYFINDIAGISPRQENLPAAFIISHSARAAALVEDARQSYQLMPADEFGLAQDPTIGGWGALPVHVDNESGLLLYYYRTFLIGDYKPLTPSIIERRLHVRIPWESVHAAFGGVSISRAGTDTMTEYDIHLQTAGQFWIETQPPPSDGFTIMFRQQGFSSGELRVGADRIAVDAPHFTLMTRDMHSLALTELDGDAGAELSVVRGGIRGRIGEVDPAATDMLIDSDTGNEITADYPGFIKKGCPGRQSAWVDIDNDGDLDLYVSCGRPKPPTEKFANQLFVNTGSGFIESAAKFGINFENYGAFRFIDWDGDLDPDLWWADAEGRLQYYENINKRFVARKSYPGRWHGTYRPPLLLIQDLTNNGLPDLFVSHPDGNGLLINHHVINESNEDEWVQPADYGLPIQSRAAHWLDIDLDGRVDLLTALHGIYLNQGGMRFSHSAATVDNAIFVQDARLVSFASDNGRQLLLAYRSCLPGKLCGARRVVLSHLRSWLRLPLPWLEKLGLIEPYEWSLMLLTPLAQNTHYKEIAISLEGSKWNPTALGGKIVLSWGEREQHTQAHWVAEADSSLYSQSDLSMAFSLPVGWPVQGRAFWPDGCQTVFNVTSKSDSMVVKRPTKCEDQSMTHN